MQLARALAAVKRAVEHLEKLYPGGQIPPQERFDHGYPYMKEYNDLETQERHAFNYDTFQPYEERFLFHVRRPDGTNLLLKFVKQYSEEAHEFCAKRGRAPKLFGFQRLVDIRKPNILVSSSDNTDFRLIDFDWAGRHGTARYPSKINPEIPWPEGVDVHALIEFEHDVQMLDYLISDS